MHDPKLAIPDEAQKNHIFLSGNTGSGKTTTCRGIIEYNLWAGRRVCILDPNDDWYGLRSSADGTKAAYAVIVFGGEHADIPIDETMGGKIGELIATTNTPAVICLKEFSPERTTKFLTPFFEAIFRLNKQVLHLVLDEAHRYIPQQPRPDQARLIHRVTDMVTGGRSRGFKFLFVTQRPARIHKDPIAMAKCFIMHEMTSSHDRKALAGWLEDAEDPKAVKEILGSLPGMPTGEGWLWIPKMKILERKKFPKGQTFDSGAAPDDGDTKAEPTKLAHVDLDAIRELLKPKAKEPAKKHTGGTPAAPVTDKAMAALQATHARDVAALHKTYGQQLEQMRKDSDARAKRINDAWRRWGQANLRTAEHLVTSLGKVFEAAQYMQGQLAMPPQIVGEATAVIPPAPAFGPGRTTMPDFQAAQDGATRQMRAAVDRMPVGDLDGPQTRIVKALATLSAIGFLEPTKKQVAIFADYSADSPSFRNAMGALQTKRMVVHGQGVAELTEAGRAHEAATVGFEGTIADVIRSRLDGPQARIFGALLELGPTGQEIARADLAPRAGYVPNVPSFRNALGALRTMEVLDYGKGTVFLKPWVYGG